MQPRTLSFELIGSCRPTKEVRDGPWRRGFDGKTLPEVSGERAVLQLAPVVIGFAGLSGGDITPLLWLLNA